MEIREDSYIGVNYCLRCGGAMSFAADHEQKLRKRCTKCGWTYYKNPIPAVACIVINEDNELLIIKRLVEPQKGMWALPSGYIEINQSPEEAAVDEMLEETGLEGEVIRFLGYYDGSSPIYEKVLSLGFLMKITGGELKAGDDAEEAKFLPFDELPELAFWAHTYFVRIVVSELGIDEPENFRYLR